MAEVRPFHYAFAVADLEVARDFYVNTLGAQEARSDELWVDFNFFGHQLSAHLIVDYPQSTYPRSLVDGDHIPIPHFGVVLTKPVWEQLAERLQALEVEFALEPKLRFKNTTGEQWSMFLYDPFLNGIEFKCFKNTEMLFASP
ncbi:MAG: glyoxalase [Acidimicrobiaceae bacterium]|nr:glyoxalase [Acidimicrobiaceae bacterium]|tara:strand:- start:87 stop:515 length:429 start_codon:yes stop_codon:yes gene_type:complete